MVTIKILINAFSNRYVGYKIEGKSRPARTATAYLLGKATFKVLSEKYNSAKIKTEDDELFEVWDVRENKQAQAAMEVFDAGAKMLSKENPLEVSYNLVTKYE